jgi:molecular chaperone GrpE
MKKKEKSSDSSKIEQLENNLKRALADYANLQRRVEEEKKLVTRFSNAVLLSKFLEVLDGLEEVKKEYPSEGLELVIKKFKDILKSEGLEEIETEGEFNPEVHEGLGLTKGEKDGFVGEVLQKGYKLEGKVLRPARVKVTKKELEN